MMFDSEKVDDGIVVLECFQAEIKTKVNAQSWLSNMGLASSLTFK